MVNLLTEFTVYGFYYHADGGFSTQAYLFNQLKKKIINNFTN